MSEPFADVIESDVLDKVVPQVEHVEKSVTTQQIAQLDTVCRADLVLAQVQFTQAGVEFDRRHCESGNTRSIVNNWNNPSLPRMASLRPKNPAFSR